MPKCAAVPVFETLTPEAPTEHEPVLNSARDGEDWLVHDVNELDPAGVPEQSLVVYAAY
jgi:hypothetical protein